MISHSVKTILEIIVNIINIIFKLFELILRYTILELVGIVLLYCLEVIIKYALIGVSKDEVEENYYNNYSYDNYTAENDKSSLVGVCLKVLDVLHRKRFLSCVEAVLHCVACLCSSVLECSTCITACGSTGLRSSRGSVT